MGRIIIALLDIGIVKICFLRGSWFSWRVSSGVFEWERNRDIFYCRRFILFVFRVSFYLN